MPRYDIFRSNARVIVARIAAVTVLGAASVASFAFSHHAAFAGQGTTEPIDLFVPGTIQPGQDVPCTVTLAPSATAAVESSHITIYSEPAGVVSYDGNVTGETVTVQANTSSTAPSGPVTVYVRTDGDQVVGTIVPVAPQSGSVR